MSFRQNGTKWCHVTLATHRNRRLFKIAAAARFCERQARLACEARGWRADGVRVKADGIQLLVEVPAGVGRGAVVAGLKADLTDALRRGRVLPSWSLKAFGSGHWCSVVTNAAGRAALLRHLNRC